MTYLICWAVATVSAVVLWLALYAAATEFSPAFWAAIRSGGWAEAERYFWRLFVAAFVALTAIVFLAASIAVLMEV